MIYLSNFHENLKNIERVRKLAGESITKAEELFAMAANLPIDKSSMAAIEEVSLKMASRTFVIASVIPLMEEIQKIFSDEEKYEYVWGNIIKYLPIDAEKQRQFKFPISSKGGEGDYIAFCYRLREYIRVMRLIKYQLKIALWY